MEQLLQIILKKLESKNIRPFGGNCGTFALALWKVFESYKPSICVMTNAEDEDELIDGEPNVYHVFLEISNKAIDGDGITSINDIVEWVDKEYNHPDVLNNYTFEYDEVKFRFNELATAIRSNTNYSYDWVDFYNIIK